MKRTRLILIVLLIAVATWAVWYFKFRKDEQPVVLDTEKPGYGYISKSVTATGTVEPVDTVSVGTQVSGTIKYVYADFNSKVKKGQLIAELDKALLQSQVNQYQAALQVAKSQLIYQQSTYDRQNSLFKTGAISKADYETANFQFASAKSSVLSAQAQLDGANKNLSYASIYSPVDGVVMARNVNIGQTVAASFSTPTLFVIAKDISNMQVQAAVDEADIGNVRQRQRATFTVDAYPENTFAGQVEEIRLEPTVAANVVTYTTIIKAPNNDLKLKPGMTANITIYTKEEPNALLISSKALKFKPDASVARTYKVGASDDSAGSGATHKHQGNPLHKRDTTVRTLNDTAVVITPKRESVWLKQNDSLIQKKIWIGLNDDTQVEVLHGLSESDEVVDGIEIAETKKSSTATKSPFMPQRAGNARKPAQPKK